MGRGRLAMKLIEKEKSRKATFLRRKNGIMKKACELSTLCGVDCCLIVYGPNSINDLPEIWPEDRIQVRRIIEKYKFKMAEKSPKKYNVTEFFKDKKNKVEAEVCKLRQERLQKLYPTWDFTFNKLGEEQLRMFVAILDSKIEDCEERIQMLKKKRYIEEKQQQIAELSSDKSSASASNRSHHNFIHSNNSSTAMLSAHHHQTLDFPLKFEDNNLHHHLMLQPFHPNLLPLTMITLNDSAETTQNDAAFDHCDLMMRKESYCPSFSWCYSSSSNNNNNNNYSPNYLQNSNSNILQIHPHEVNLQVNNNVPAAPLMMEEFQSYHHFGYNQHDLLQVHHQKFNYMDQDK